MNDTEKNRRQAIREIAERIKIVSPLLVGRV